MKFLSLLGCLVTLSLSLAGGAARAADTLDSTSRTAVMSAFQPEWTALQAQLRDRKDYVINGMTFETGTIEGKPVVLFLSGISMVNAAMTTQLVVDRFAIDRIVFSGIAGGVDPGLAIGDVVVPSEWTQYLEVVFARKSDHGYVLPSYAERRVANYGMMFPQPVEIPRESGAVEKRTWFPVDPQLLTIAKSVAGAAKLRDCTPDNKCLTRKPKIVVGGNGVSGQAFVDNKAFRQDLRRRGPRHGKRGGGPCRLHQPDTVHRLPQPLRPRRRRQGRERDGHVLPARGGQLRRRGRGVSQGAAVNANFARA